VGDIPHRQSPLLVSSNMEGAKGPLSLVCKDANSVMRVLPL
jgi:hypothetical protein